MPHTRADLDSLYNHLSKTELDQRLLAGGVQLDKQVFTEEDIGNFDKICQLFDTGQVKAGDYEGAKELFATLAIVKSTKARSPKPVETVKNNKSKKDLSANSLTPNPASNSTPPFPHSATAQESKQSNQGEENLSIIDLMNQAKQHLGLDLTLKQVVTIQEVAGLPDKQFYTQAEANRFLIACKVLLEGNNDISSQVENAATAMETGIIGLVREVTSERAKAVPDLVKQLYLQNVVLSLAENQDDIESFFLQIKDSIIAGIEGKSPLRSIMEVEWMPTLLGESNNSQILPLQISKNPTSEESKPSAEP
jgi:hypothetical protein